jgi:hypothetical protein
LEITIDYNSIGNYYIYQNRKLIKGDLMQKRRNKILIEAGINIFKEVTPEISRNLEQQNNIFLIGKSMNEHDSLRLKINNSIKPYHRIKIHLPEQIFKDILLDKNYDLLNLENLLAESVDAVVMCIESPGSIAELGAFANHKFLKEKLIVYMNDKYKKDRSFINLGPVKFLKKETKSKVIWFDYDSEFNNEVLNLRKYINQIKSFTIITQGLTNLFFSELFLLTLVYPFGEIESSILFNIIRSIEKNNNRQDFDIKKSTSIAGLLLKSNNFIKENDRDISYYSLTEQGRIKLKQEFDSKFIHKKLDNLRIQLLNLKLRKLWV